MYRFRVLKFGLGDWTFLLPIVPSVWFLPSRERGPVSRESKAGVGTRILAPDVILPNGTVTSALGALISKLMKPGWVVWVISKSLAGSANPGRVAYIFGQLVSVQHADPQFLHENEAITPAPPRRKEWLRRSFSVERSVGTPCSQQSWGPVNTEGFQRVSSSPHTALQWQET